jgi:hypothetical protein
MPNEDPASDVPHFGRSDSPKIVPQVNITQTSDAASLVNKDSPTADHVSILKGASVA